jgi:hypothetical protein
MDLWLGAWTVEGMVVHGPALCGKEQAPLPLDYCGGSKPMTGKMFGFQSCLTAVWFVTRLSSEPTSGKLPDFYNFFPPAGGLLLERI